MGGYKLQLVSGGYKLQLHLCLSPTQNWIGENILE